MTRLSAPNDVTVDRTGQRIAYVLWEADKQDEIRTTTQFRRQLDLNQNQIARNRLRGTLADADLVEHAGTQPSGGPEPVDCWTITETGKQWVVDNIEDIAPPQTLDEACEQIRAIADRLEKIESQLETINGKVGWDRRRLEDIDARYHHVHEQYKDLAGLYKELQAATESNYDDLCSHADHLTQFYQQLDVEPPEETG